MRMGAAARRASSSAEWCRGSCAAASYGVERDFRMPEYDANAEPVHTVRPVSSGAGRWNEMRWPRRSRPRAPGTGMSSWTEIIGSCELSRSLTETHLGCVQRLCERVAGSSRGAGTPHGHQD
jgi:hypothetical protein